MGVWVRTCSAHGLNFRSCCRLRISSRGGAAGNGGKEMQTKGWGGWGWKRNKPREPSCQRMAVPAQSCNRRRIKAATYLFAFVPKCPNSQTKRISIQASLSLRLELTVWWKENNEDMVCDYSNSFLQKMCGMRSDTEKPVLKLRSETKPGPLGAIVTKCDSWNLDDTLRR